MPALADFALSPPTEADRAFDLAYPAPETLAQRRGYLAQAGAGLAQGATGALALPLRAASAFPVVRTLTEPLAEGIERLAPIQGPGVLEAGVRTAGQSLGALGLAGAATLIPGVGPAAVPAIVGGLFGAGQVAETRNRLEKLNALLPAEQRLSPAQIYTAGVGAGLVEAVGETASAFFLQGRFFPKTAAGLAAARNYVVTKLIPEGTSKVLQLGVKGGEEYVRSLGRELPTEIGQNVLETQIERQALGEARLDRLTQAGAQDIPASAGAVAQQTIGPVAISSALVPAVLGAVKRFAQPMPTNATSTTNVGTPPPAEAPPPGVPPGGGADARAAQLLHQLSQREVVPGAHQQAARALDTLLQTAGPGDLSPAVQQQVDALTAGPTVAATPQRPAPPGLPVTAEQALTTEENVALLNQRAVPTQAQVAGISPPAAVQEAPPVRTILEPGMGEAVPPPTGPDAGEQLLRAGSRARAALPFELPAGPGETLSREAIQAQLTGRPVGELPSALEAGLQRYPVPVERTTAANEPPAAEARGGGEDLAGPVAAHQGPPSVPAAPAAEQAGVPPLQAPVVEPAPPVADAPREAGQPAPPALPARERLGHVNRVLTPANRVAQSLGQEDVETRFAVVEAPALIHSFDTRYPPELQPRLERQPGTVDAATEATIARIAHKPDFLSLAESRQAGEGAPIIDPRGYSLSGTARIEGLKRMYSTGGDVAQRYRGEVIAHAARLGLDASQIAPMRQPVLVRVLTTPMSQEQLVQFADEANQRTSQAPGAVSTAVQDAKRLTPEILSQMVPHSETGTVDLMSAANQPFLQAVLGAIMGPTEIGQVYVHGQLTTEGADRVRRAIFARAYGNSPALERLIQDQNDARKSVGQGLLLAAPAMARLQQAIDDGSAYPLSITGDVVQAANKLVALAHMGQTVEGWLRQQEREPALFDETLSPVAKELMQLLDRPKFKRSARQVAALFHTYIESVYAAGMPGGLFETGGPLPTPADLLIFAAEQVEDNNGHTNQATLFPDQRGRAPGNVPVVSPVESPAPGPLSAAEPPAAPAAPEQPSAPAAAPAAAVAIPGAAAPEPQLAPQGLPQTRAAVEAAFRQQATRADQGSFEGQSIAREAATVGQVFQRLAGTGWQTLRDLSPRRRAGSEPTQAVVRALQFLRAHGATQIAWDQTGTPYHARAGLDVPAWLTTTDTDAARAALPPVPPRGGQPRAQERTALPGVVRPRTAARGTLSPAELAAYFTPGALVPSYGGQDRVLAFEPLPDNNFRVQVQAVDTRGNPVPDDPSPRWHSTPPTRREFTQAMQTRQSPRGGQLQALQGNAEAGQGQVTLAEVQRLFRGQEVTETPEGTLRVTMPVQGHTLDIVNVAHITPTEAELEVSIGQPTLGPTQRVLGRATALGQGLFRIEVTPERTTSTLFHEGEHFFEDAGLFTAKDIATLNRTLQRQGHEPTVENRADLLAARLNANTKDILASPFLRVVRKAQQFLDALVRLLGFRTTGQLVRAVQNGAIFQREGGTGEGTPGRLQVVTDPDQPALPGLANTQASLPSAVAPVAPAATPRTHPPGIRTERIPVDHYQFVTAITTPEERAQFQELEQQGVATFRKERIGDVQMESAGEAKKTQFQNNPRLLQRRMEQVKAGRNAFTEPEFVALMMLAHEELAIAKVLHDQGIMSDERFAEAQDAWIAPNAFLSYTKEAASTFGRGLRLAGVMGQLLGGAQTYANAMAALEQKLNAIPEAERDAFKQKLLDAFNAKDYATVRDLAAQIPSSTLRERFFEFYYGSILSGVGTQSTNVWSTAAYQLFHNALVRPIAGLTDQITAGVTGRDRQVFAGEMLPALLTQFRGLPAVFRNAWWVWNGDARAQHIPAVFRRETGTGRDQDTAVGAWARATYRQDWPLLGKHAGEPIQWMRTLAPLVTAASRLMGAIDVGMSLSIFEQEVAARAHRAALQQGIPADQRAAFEADYRAHFLTRHPPGVGDQTFDEVFAIMQRQVFHDGTGVLGRTLINLRHLPGLGAFFQLLMPFAGTPDALLRRGLELLPGTPLVNGWYGKNVSWKWGGWLPMVGKEALTNEAMFMLARQALGILMTAGLYALWHAGRISGPAPDDPNERDADQRTGKIPFSVKVGDTWYSWRKFEPLSLPLGILTTVFDTLKRREERLAQRQEVPVGLLHDSLAIAAVGVQSALTYILDASYFAGLANFVEGTVQGQRSGTGDIPKALMRQVSSMVTPWVGLQRSLIAGLDTTGLVPGSTAGQVTIRSPQTLGESLLGSVFPFALLEGGPKPRLNVFGQPATRQSSLVGEVVPLIPPVQRGYSPSNTLEETLARVRYYPGQPAKTDAVTGKALAPEVYRRLQELRGPLVQRSLERLVNTGLLDRMEPFEAKKKLQNVVADATRQAKRALALETR